MTGKPARWTRTTSSGNIMPYFRPYTSCVNTLVHASLDTCMNGACRYVPERCFQVAPSLCHTPAATHRPGCPRGNSIRHCGVCVEIQRNATGLSPLLARRRKGHSSHSVHRHSGGTALNIIIENYSSCVHGTLIRDQQINSLILLLYYNNIWISR
jgi:hypothetical protein